MARIDLSLVSSSSGVFPSRSRWRAAGQRDGRIEVPRSGLLGGVVLPIHMTSSAAVLDEVTHRFCRRPQIKVSTFGIDPNPRRNDYGKANEFILALGALLLCPRSGVGA